jgi:hypothetical protein
VFTISRYSSQSRLRWPIQFSFSSHIRHLVVPGNLPSFHHRRCALLLHRLGHSLPEFLIGKPRMSVE